MVQVREEEGGRKDGSLPYTILKTALVRCVRDIYSFRHLLEEGRGRGDRTLCLLASYHDFARIFKCSREGGGEEWLYLKTFFCH